MSVPIFDGHNDVLLKLWSAGGTPADTFSRGGSGHLDVPKARAGGFAGGFFAIFVPPGGRFDMSALDRPAYDIPLPPPIAHGDALPVVLAQAGILRDLDSAGQVRLCLSVADIDAAMADGVIAAIMHVEGAEAIGPDLEALDTLHALGLRSIGPVWSRPTIFGEGVPFRYPSDGNIGSGLTDSGRALVRKAADLKLVVDTSHLNTAGFWDVADAGLPLVATHSNAHAISPISRNLTDDQLRAIGETGGIVGLNYATAMLRPDGRMRPEGAFEWMVRHLDHMIGLAGEDHVALGSDFDGAVVPQEIGSAAGLDVLRKSMHDAGYGEALIAKICHGNWLAALRRIWGG